MDALDVAILRETSHPRAGFRWNVRESYRSLAETLGVDEETVRLRVKRLQEEGVLRGFELVVNPDLLGRVMLRVDLPRLPDERKDALLQQAPLLEGARWLFDLYDGGVGVVLFARPDEVPRQVALLEAMAGAKGEAWQVPTPPCDAEPSRLDWRLLHALRRDPRRPYGELAEALGVSAKTVKRRVQRLMDARACFMSAVVDFSRARGVIPAEVVVFHESPEHVQGVDAYLRSVPNRVFERCTPRVSSISFVAFSMAEVDDVRRALATLPGAQRHRVRVILRRVTLDDWLDARLAREAGSPDAEAAAT